MTDPLRILIANSGRRWIGEVGHCALLYEALAARGHHVLLACRRGSALEAYAEEHGFNFIALEFHSQPRPSDWTDLKQLESRVLEQNIQLIHAHRGKDHWQGVLLSRRLRIPLVRTRHVVTPAAQHAMNRWLYGRGTHALISVSAAAERSLGKLAKGCAIRSVIHSAVDAEKFHPRHRSEAWRHRGLAEGAPEPLWIGLIARMQRIKGQRPFLEAAALIAGPVPGARFFLAGRKGQLYRNGCVKFATERGFGDRIEVEGMLENLPAAMASFDIGVVASLGSEGMSRVTLEYMASGVPVVATSVGAIPELLERKGEEPLGVVVPPGDPAAMAAALLELIRDPERRRLMAGRARAAIERHHNLEGWTQAVVDVYRRALAAAR